MPLPQEPAGNIDGQGVTRYTLRNRNVVEVSVLTYGAIIQRLIVPDRSGKRDNIVLGYGTADEYAYNPHYFGCVAGRFANRIGGGSFELDGYAVQLARNSGAHTLHGGDAGFDCRHWIASEAHHPAGGESLVLRLHSPDGDQGFPGNLDSSVQYTLTKDNRFIIDYQATTDTPTLVNLTQHTYFNLEGEGSGSALDHELTINASSVTPTDEDQIATGDFDRVRYTPFDFRKAKPVGRDIRETHEQLVIGRGYDINFVLDQGDALEDDVVKAATLVSPASGRSITIRTSEPGLQLYTGNYLDGSDVGAGGRTYRQGDGIALETQHFPDSPNKPHFPSAVLRPGEEYTSRTIWEFSW